jgi:fucose 4-O-acetylase-like acetyltransferase
MSSFRDCITGGRAEAKARLAWLDTLKSLGIIFVIYGHAPGLTKGVEVYLFSFHMPLFFFISGIFFPSATDRSLGSFAAERAVRRLVPYLFFGLLTYAVWFFVTRHFGRNVAMHVNPAVPFFGLFYGSSWGNLLIANVPLWFLPCLFVTEVLFAAIVRRWPNLSGRVLALAACGLAGVAMPRLLPFRLPLSADVALVAVGFYGAGFLLRDRLLETRRLPLPWLAAAGALSLWLGVANGKVAMDGAWYSNNFIFFYLAAAVGILFWSGIAKRLGEGLPWLTLVGRHTMVLFCLHFFAFAILSGVLTLVFRIPLDSIKAAAVAAPIYTAWTVLFLLPLSRFITARAPLLVGQRPKPHPRT